MININVTVSAKEFPVILETLKKEGLLSDVTANVLQTETPLQATGSPIPTQPVNVQTFPVQPVINQPVNVQPVAQTASSGSTYPTVSAQPVNAQPAYDPITGQQVISQIPAAVPTETKTYTLEQLQLAATQLMDAGRRQDVLNLLTQFGVPSMLALSKEAYGAFATKLRELGAKI